MRSVFVFPGADLEQVKRQLTRMGLAARVFVGCAPENDGPGDVADESDHRAGDDEHKGS